MTGHLLFDLSVGAEAALDAAEAAVRAGECIVLPTDTVYGIGADASSAVAVQRVLDAKHRGRDMPPPILIADAADLADLGEAIDPRVWSLVAAFWPGPLTVVVRARPALRLDLGDKQGTLAVRVPDQPVTRALLRRTGPLAVSSANVSGLPPATTVEEAIEQLGDSVAVYLDGGPTGEPVPSTIVDMTGVPTILREGAISVAELNAVVPGLITDELSS